MEVLSSASIMCGRSSNSSVEIIASDDRISQLPEEMIQNIFSYLNLKELGSNSLVCKKWHRLSTDPCLLNKLELRKAFPHLSIFDASDWKKHFGLSVEDAPPMHNCTLLPILKQFSSLPIEKMVEENEDEQVQKDAGFTLLTIPKKLTLRNLIDMTNDEKTSRSLVAIDDVILTQHGDISSDETYRILITNNVLKNSQAKSIHNQRVLVEEEWGYKIPKAREVLALIVTTFISTGKRLYNVESKGDACCSELVDRPFQRPVVVGNFQNAILGLGISVYTTSFTAASLRTHTFVGAAACQKI